MNGSCDSNSINKLHQHIDASLATTNELRINYNNNQHRNNSSDRSTMADTSTDVQFEQQFFAMNRTADRQLHFNNFGDPSSSFDELSNGLSGQLERSSVYNNTDSNSSNVAVMS